MQVVTAAEELAVLFSWLANELDARLSVGTVDGDDIPLDDDTGRNAPRGGTAPRGNAPGGENEAADDAPGDSGLPQTQPQSLAQEETRRRENRDGIWALAYDMRESSTVLARAAAADWGSSNHPTDSVGTDHDNNPSSASATNKSSSATNTSSSSASGVSGGGSGGFTSATSTSAAASIAFTCFRWGGYITRSLTSRGALALPFEELTKAAHEWSRRELAQCGLGGYEYAFTETTGVVIGGGAGGAGAKGGGRKSTAGTGGRPRKHDSTKTLLQLARATENCRRFGGGGGGGIGPGAVGAGGTIARQLREIRAHYIAVEAALREANGATNCLHTAPAAASPSSPVSTVPSPEVALSLAPELDPETESPHGSRLATGWAEKVSKPLVVQ
jgi:hypothetical protein